MQETIFIRDLAVVLLAAATSGWLLQRLGLSAVVGYLLAGIAIGPFSPILQLVSNQNHIQLLAQMGLVFLMHMAFQLLLVSAVLLASRRIYETILDHVGRDFLFPHGLPVLFWTGFAIVLLGPLIVIWRHLEALTMIVAEAVTQRAAKADVLRPLLQTLLTAVAAFVLLAWLLLLVPFGPWVFWTLFIAGAGVLLFAPLFWRRLVRLHSRFEVEFRETMKSASTTGASSGLPVSVLERPQEWNLQIDEVALPFSTGHAGRRITELGIRQKFGCSILAIERQGLLIANPSGEERLFANDKLLLLGAAEQLPAAEQFLVGRSVHNPDARGIDDIAMEILTLPDQGQGLGRTLSELKLVERFGIQVCGIQRGDQRILVPASSERIMAGDRLLLLGAHNKIRDFRTFVWH